MINFLVSFKAVVVHAGKGMQRQILGVFFHGMVSFRVLVADSLWISNGMQPDMTLYSVQMR